ncbi:MAG: glycosyltransferase [Fimbriimonadaceae bacterium]
MSATTQKARALHRQLKFIVARELLTSELKRAPDCPALNAEYGYQLCFAQKEFEAVPYWEKSGGNEELRQILVNYFHCRKQLTDKLGIPDLEAESLAKRVPGSPTNGIGAKLSACLIVKNEEKHLDRCLNSLKGVCDEIVVVDTGSTDKTVEIALRHGATIGHFEWCNDFAAARNASLELATGNWALWIDADEELTEESKKSFLEALSRPHFGGFYVQIVNFLDDTNELNNYVHAPVRLFRLTPEIRFEGRIHEQILNSFEKHNLIAATLSNAKINHYGYAPSVMQEKDKLARTIEMLEREVAENPNDAFQLFNLANAYAVGKAYANTEAACRRALPHLVKEMPFATVTYQLLASSLISQGKHSEAVAICDEAKSRGFHTLLNDFERAHALFRLGRFPQALEALDRCLSAEWTSAITGDSGIQTYKGQVLKAQILSGLGRNEEALSNVDEALKSDPNFPIGLLARAQILQRMEHRLEAGYAYLAVASKPGYENAYALAGGEFLLAGDYHLAVLPLQTALKVSATKDVVQALLIASETAERSIRLESYAAIEACGLADELVYTNWGRLLSDQDDIVGALEKFQLALNIAPNNANAYFNAGDLLYRIGGFNEAARMYEAGLKLDPTNCEGWFVFGNSLAQGDVPQAAVLAYNQVLTLNPEHQGARHNRELMAA